MAKKKIADAVKDDQMIFSQRLLLSSRATLNASEGESRDLLTCNPASDKGFLRSPSLDSGSVGMTDESRLIHSPKSMPTKCEA